MALKIIIVKPWRKPACLQAGRIFQTQRSEISTLVGSLCLTASLSFAQAANVEITAAKKAADAWLQENFPTMRQLNQNIWDWAELGLEETRSSQALASFLERNGFQVERGVADLPTAFVASFGKGRPVIGILAEYDALPGMSQKAASTQEPRAGATNGHACGHCIFGVASAGAAAALRSVIEQTSKSGTIRLYGTPAEETLIGKVYLAKAGLFDDCDAVLHWHPSDKTDAGYTTTKAMVSVKFRFTGLGAHASTSPHLGRSALDAVELMNIGCNYLREHVREDARIHYVITDGGGQPNVVPPLAEVWYYLRANQHQEMARIYERVMDIAKGAALMTGTKVAWTIETDTAETLPNRPLAELMQQNLLLVGPPQFTESEKNFARATQKDFETAPARALSEKVEDLPEEPSRRPGSTDVASISWRVPTGGFFVTSYTYGAAGHSWPIVACTGMSIGEKGMLVAARALAYTTLDLLTHPTWLERAKGDFQARTTNQLIRPLLPPEQKPPSRIR